ncbi:unnamed protein product [Moneuplotes crassus]|uniref:Uncharacterized protein n=1 Tax=Euplotes crassus TaxID=5936 RepID=A0AAD1U388_EUPCR|nr:unnamed protein product [Moneuplotes crassus]
MADPVPTEPTPSERSGSASNCPSSRIDLGGDGVVEEEDGGQRGQRVEVEKVEDEVQQQGEGIKPQSHRTSSPSLNEECEQWKTNIQYEDTEKQYHMFDDLNQYDQNEKLFIETFEDELSGYENQDIVMKEGPDSSSDVDFEDCEYLHQEYTDEEIFTLEKVGISFREKLPKSHKNGQKNVQKEGLSDVEKELLDLHHNLAGNKQRIIDHLILEPHLLLYFGKQKITNEELGRKLKILRAKHRRINAAVKVCAISAQ